MPKIHKVLTLVFGQGLNIVVNLLFLPYMARMLDYQQYGTYGQVLLIVSFCAALLSFGLPQIIYVYLANDERSSRSTVLSTSLLSSLLIGLFGVSLILLLSNFFMQWFDNEGLGDSLKIYAFSLLFILPFQCINSYFIFFNKVRTSALIAVVTNLIKVGLVVFSIQLYRSVQLAILSVLFSEFFQVIIGLILVKGNVKFSLNFTLVKELLKKGFPLGLTGVLGASILYVDSLMISSMEGVKSYAIYRNGAIEVPFISTLYASIAAIVLPEVAKLFKASNFDRILELKRKVIMNSMMLTYPVLIFLLFNAHNIIVVYLGQMYEDSAIIFAVFNLTLLVRVTNYSDILISANKSAVILKIYLLTFLLNIGMNYCLINLFGIVGAAISTVISLFLLATLQLGTSLKLIGKKLTNLIDGKSLLIMLSICLLLSSILRFIFIDSGELSFLIFGAFYFPIIYFILLRFGFFSRELLNQLLPKFLTKKRTNGH